MDMPMDTATTMSSTMNSTSTMTMTFHTGIHEALWWSSWTPNTPVAYAFTFLFLVAVAIFSRALHAAMAVHERHIRVTNMANAHIVVIQNRGSSIEKIREAAADDPTTVMLQKGGVAIERDSQSISSHEEATAVRLINPWRLSVDLPRGFLFFLHSGIGYLLMLAIMTANVGYFFAVLSGLFIGEVAFGRYAFAPVVAPEVAHS